MELHNNEVLEDLRANMGYDPASPSTIATGEGLVACCPHPRRGLVLIGPGLKEDYFAVVDTP